MYFNQKFKIPPNNLYLEPRYIKLIFYLSIIYGLTKKKKKPLVHLGFYVRHRLLHAPRFPSCTMVLLCVTILLFLVSHSDERIINSPLTKILFVVLFCVIFFDLLKIFKQGLFIHPQPRFFQVSLTNVLLDIFNQNSSRHLELRV